MYCRLCTVSAQPVPSDKAIGCVLTASVEVGSRPDVIASQLATDHALAHQVAAAVVLAAPFIQFQQPATGVAHG